MNLNTVLTISAVIAAVFGIGFIFAPEAMQRPYGIDALQAASSAHIGRLLGAYMLSFAILFWFMRGTASSDVKTAVVKAISLAFFVGVLVSLTEQIRGTFGPLGWSTVAIYGVFGAVYAYFGFSKGAEA